MPLLTSPNFVRLAQTGSTSLLPTHVLASTAGTNLAMDGTGAISGLPDGNSLSLSMPAFLEDGTYQEGLTYQASAPLPAGVSLSSAGALTVSNAPTTTASVTIQAINGWGNASSIPLKFDIVAPSPTLIAGGIADQQLTNGIFTVDLATVFAGATSFSVTANPESNATLAGSVLTVQGASRGATYTVTVQATDSTGSVSDSFSVTEGAEI